jgi:hypothetical protein
VCKKWWHTNRQYLLRQTGLNYVTAETMVIINLDNLDGLPTRFLEELKGVKGVLQQNKFLESLLHRLAIADLMKRINEYCLKNYIYGYHYTRAIPEEIAKTGLTCRDGDTIRGSFLEKFGHLFTKEEIIRMKKNWLSHFTTHQKRIRDNRLYFNFTTKALKSFGADSLLLNFGGEQIYMPLQEAGLISDKIRNIGQPLILKCRLDPNNLNTFYENPWGRIAISTYHCQVNPDAHRDDQDGSQSVDVKAEDIELVAIPNG